MPTKLTAARLRELLFYEPGDGTFTWRKNVSPQARSGVPAGCKNESNYIVIRVDGVKYYAHRLAWLYVTGSWPSKSVDHVNGNCSDNSWANLRLADQAENTANSKLSRANTSGHKGVVFYRPTKKWRAQIGVGLTNKHIGYFEKKEDAAAAYLAAAKSLFGEFARAR